MKIGKYDLPVNYKKLHWAERRSVRNQYVSEQNGNCCHCGANLKDAPRSNVAAKPIKRRLFPRSFFNHPIHLHHNHKTGMTIGAVHNICNAVLWQYHGK